MTYEPSDLTTPSNRFSDYHEGVSIEERRQRQNEIIVAKREECTTLLNTQIYRPGYCNGTFDGGICWDPTPAGQLAVTSCPEYIAGFNPKHNATRFCTPDGTWFFNPETNSTWTNYSQCTSNHNQSYQVNQVTHELIAEWLPVIKKVSQVGYSLSFLTLVIAVFILLSIKKLRCPRNTLHMHLFVSFICRAFMALLKDSLFIEGIGLSHYALDSAEVSTWQCKLLTSLWEYFIVANYTWILMEGLYLHNLIFLAPFSDSSAITAYVLLGWGCPIPVVGSWVVSRVLWDDTLCWTTHPTIPNLFLIIRIPIIVSIVLNFIFFVNIVRVLLLKLQSAVSIETRKYRYRKWAKSTLVLVPLFGVHYMLFMGMSFYIGRDPVIEVTWLFCDQLFASFQGFFVAILYCLLNGEVRCELGKKWTTWKSETDTKNIWVPLNHITTRIQRRSTHDDLLTNGLSVTGGTTDRNIVVGKGGKYRKSHDVKIIDGPKHPEDQELTEENNLTNDTHAYCIDDFISASPPLFKEKQNNCAK